DDKLLVFVTGSNSLRGILQVASPWSPVSTPRYPDEIHQGTVIYPYEAQVRTVVTGLAHIRKLRHDLSFIKEKQNVGLYLRRSPGNFGKPLSEQDHSLILHELEKNPEPADLAG